MQACREESSQSHGCPGHLECPGHPAHCLGAFKYVNSDTYVGRQYKEIYQSPYATDEERKMLGKDLYYFGVVPREFHQTPTLTKAKIKRNKQILRQRKAEKAKTGKFSTKVALKR